ncbi:UxaA family hydrolase [Candidatus Phycosocius bacilliformis]|nr:UxaA family hydrolase [Candidatus Phycosocius bacilliformis]
MLVAARGCGMAGYARHANFHSVVLIGLGYKVTQSDRVRDQMGLSPSINLHRFTIQDVGETSRAIEHGAALVAELLREADTARRQPAPLNALKLGLPCGGSDGWSGVTANPALGVASDLLVAHGGTAILSETPEIYGAEALLLARAQSPEIADKLNARLAWWQIRAFL